MAQLDSLGKPLLQVGHAVDYQRREVSHLAGLVGPNFRKTVCHRLQALKVLANLGNQREEVGLGRGLILEHRYPTVEGRERRSQLVRGFAGHSGPNLVFFGAASAVKSVVR